MNINQYLTAVFDKYDVKGKYNVNDILRFNSHIIAQYNNIINAKRRFRVWEKKVGRCYPLRSSNGSEKDFYFTHNEITLILGEDLFGRVLCANIIDSVKPDPIDRMIQCFKCCF